MSVFGHERDLAEIYFLLFDILDVLAPVSFTTSTPQGGLLPSWAPQTSFRAGGTLPHRISAFREHRTHIQEKTSP